MEAGVLELGERTLDAYVQRIGWHRRKVTRTCGSRATSGIKWPAHVVTGIGIARLTVGQTTRSMPDDLSAARRAERSRARWTTYLLLGCLALDAVAIAAGLSQRALIARLAAGVQLLPGDVAANDARHRIVGLLKLAAFLGTGIVWLTWFYRAYGNLGLVGSKRSRFPQGWAVGYWLIPFVNLVRAYQTMKDLWLRSESLNDRDGYDNLPAPAFLAAWWGVYWMWAPVDRVFGFLAPNTQSVGDLTNVTDLEMLVNVVGIVAALLAIKVVREIDRHQQRFHDAAGVTAPRY